LHYFNSNEKLGNSCCDLWRDQRAVRLSNENDKWLRFNNYSRKVQVPFVVYADLECILEKTNSDPRASQHYRVFSLAYYVHCWKFL